MPLLNGTWQAGSTAEYLQEIRADLDSKLGTSIDYVATVDGAWTLAAAEIMFRIDQYIADFFASINNNTASRETLISRLLAIGITPRAATFSRVTAFKNGIGVLPINSIVQTNTTLVPPFGQNVIDPQGQWKVVDNDSDNPSDLAVMVLESLVAGQVTAGSPTATFTLVTPVPGITDLEYDEGEGSTRTIGRPAETTPELRSRFSIDRIGVGGSIPAVRQAIFNLPFVRGAAVSGSAGNIYITVTPGPTGEDEENLLAYTIYASTPPGTWVGTQTKTITGIDGVPVDIKWSVGVEEEVEIAIIDVDYNNKVAEATVNAAIISNIQAEFSKILTGGPAVYQWIYSAARTEGMIKLVMTMNGTTNNVVYPSNSANILVPVFV